MIAKDDVGSSLERTKTASKRMSAKGSVLSATSIVAFKVNAVVEYLTASNRARRRVVIRTAYTQ